MVEMGMSFGLGLIIGGLSLMLAWGLLWLVIGGIGLARQTCGWAIFMSSVSSTAIAGLLMAGALWLADSARLTSAALQVGLAVGSHGREPVVG